MRQIPSLAEMAVALHNARLSFLENAARTYLQADSTTSAHLMAQRNLVSAGDGRIPGGDLSCRACGTILISGCTSSATFSAASTRKSRPRNEAKRRIAPVNERSVQIKCLMCHHYVKHALLNSSVSPYEKNFREEKAIISCFEYRRSCGIYSNPYIDNE